MRNLYRRLESATRSRENGAPTLKLGWVVTTGANLDPLPTPIETGRPGNMVRGPRAAAKDLHRQDACVTPTPLLRLNALEGATGILACEPEKRARRATSRNRPNLFRVGDLDARTLKGGSRQPQGRATKSCRFFPGAIQSMVGAKHEQGFPEG